MEKLKNLYVCEGGEVGFGDHPGRIFLCRPGVDDNVAECFDTDGLTAREAGEQLSNAVKALALIHHELDGVEWDGGTASRVADILIRAGYKIRASNEEERAHAE